MEHISKIDHHISEINQLPYELLYSLSAVEGLTLPINGEYKPAATLENIEKAIKKKLSDFNKALLKARKYKSNELLLFPQYLALALCL